MSETERERTPEDEQDERDERIMALVARGVKRFMHEQQQGLLHTAAKNSQAIVNTEIQASCSKVQDTIDEGLEKVQEYEDIKWKSKINKNNFDFARQVSELWEKTERAATEEKPDRVKELCQKGKKIAKQRMKVLRLADKDGWGTAFEYLSDDLADDEQDRKRMKKAKKSAEAKEKSKEEAAVWKEEGQEGIRELVGHAGDPGIRRDIVHARQTDHRTPTTLEDTSVLLFVFPLLLKVLQNI